MKPALFKIVFLLIALVSLSCKSRGVSEDFSEYQEVARGVYTNTAHFAIVRALEDGTIACESMTLIHFKDGKDYVLISDKFYEPPNKPGSLIIILKHKERYGDYKILKGN